MIAIKKRVTLSVKFLFVLLLAALSGFSQTKKTFTVVLDAGHGGNDPGAIGQIMQEKKINLSVVLLLGEMIERNNPDVKVVYTRKTDVFIPLQERAQIANNAHADLFVSIHVNASKNKEAFGTETYTLGLTKSKSNLDVAMRENSVILLESDYKEKYKGFDPQSVDSYIMFEFMQDKYIDKSIGIASDIQHYFVRNAKRKDRGVRQAGFWVLHKTAMPSVLVELGYISNSEEEKYLSTIEGQKQMADAIYLAFLKFKHEHEKKSSKLSQDIIVNQGDVGIGNDSGLSSEVSVQQNQAPSLIADSSSLLKSDMTVYRIQLFATKQLIKNQADFKGLKVEYYIENGLYKYTYGSTTSFEEISKLRKEILEKFKDAFIIAFKNGQKVSVQETLKK